MAPSTSIPKFLVRTTVLHAITYLVVGLLAATVLNYRQLFEEPVIRDYMRPFGSASPFVGVGVQVVRGLIIAGVLLPVRALLGGRWGWLWLWLLLVGIGILSTSAAAPSSIEGVVYSQLPIWYHLIGLPEMLLQTLAFSTLVWMYERNPQGLMERMPPVLDRVVRALVVACIAFAAYAVVSVVFALAAGADLTASENVSLRTQGVFVVPLISLAVIAFVGIRTQRSVTWSLLAAAAAYAVGAAAILAYQFAVLGEASPGYALLAPILPAIVVGVAIRRGHPSESDRRA